MPEEVKDFLDDVGSEEAKRTKAFRRLESNLTTKVLWLYVLRLLIERDMYGYEVRKAIKEQYKIRMATVTAYVVLYKLAQEKLVTTEKSPSSFRGRPDRKYYSITSKGQKVLLEAQEYFSNVYKQIFDIFPNKE